MRKRVPAQTRAEGRSAQIPFVLLDKQLRFSVANEAARALFGLSDGEIEGQEAVAALEPYSGKETRSLLLRALAGESVGLQPDHESNASMPPLDLYSVPEGLAIIGSAVNEDGQKERARAHLAAIVESSDDAIVSKTLDGIIVTWNKAAEGMFGYSAEEAVGQPITLIIPADRLHEEPEILRRIRSGERVEHFDTVRQRKDGRLINVSVTISPMRDSTGKILGASKIARDITERKEQEQREEFLNRATRLLATSIDWETTVDQISHLVVPRLGDWCVIDMKIDGAIERVSVVHPNEEKLREAQEGLRRNPSRERSDRGAARVIETGEAELYPDLSAQIDEVSQDREQANALREFGLTSAMVVPISYGVQVLGAVTIVSAESGRRYTQADLRLAEELGRRMGFAVENARLYREAQKIQEELRLATEAKDEFMGMVSHELRTPITTIFGGARILELRNASLDEESKAQLVSDMRQETERLARMVENLLVLSRLETGGRPQLEPLLLNRVADKVVEAFSRTRPDREIGVEAEPGLPPVAGQETYVEQVLTNLLSNADKYSQPGSPIDIAIQADVDGVTVSVMDRGIGVEPDEVDAIFGRFYRSPAVGKTTGGAGLGLTVCKRLIEAQSGDIWAERRPGGGLTVAFTLPVYAHKPTVLATRAD